MTQVFGAKNSNWRGPVWVQMNYLFIDMLHKRAKLHLEKDLKRSVPHLSHHNEELTDTEIARQLSERIINLFRKRPDDQSRPCHGQNLKTIDFYKKQQPLNTSSAANGACAYESESDLILFYEFFHGENGSGLGASHQSWTTIVANLISELNQEDGESP